MAMSVELTGRVVMRERFHKHRPGDAWTNYFWTYYHQFGK
jgi:hypothetical protein